MMLTTWKFLKLMNNLDNDLYCLGSISNKSGEVTYFPICFMEECITCASQVRMFDNYFKKEVLRVYQHTSTTLEDLTLSIAQSLHSFTGSRYTYKREFFEGCPTLSCVSIRGRLHERIYTLGELKDSISKKCNNLILQNISLPDYNTFISGIGINKNELKLYNGNLHHYTTNTIAPRKAVIIHMCHYNDLVKNKLDHSLYWGILEVNRPKKYNKFTYDTINRTKIM